MCIVGLVIMTETTGDIIAAGVDVTMPVPVPVPVPVPEGGAVLQDTPSDSR